jgi:hypothetical protein
VPSGWRHAVERCEVAGVHGKDPVEVLEVGSRHLSGDASNLDAAAHGGLPHPGVRALADVPCACSRRVDDELAVSSGFRHEVKERSFCGRRAADVAETDEQDPNRRCGG